MDTKDMIEIKAGFLPYTDGSGHEVKVTITMDNADAPAEMRIECINKFDVDHWAALKAGIDRLLKAVP